MRATWKKWGNLESQGKLSTGSPLWTSCGLQTKKTRQTLRMREKCRLPSLCHRQAVVRKSNERTFNQIRPLRWTTDQYPVSLRTLCLEKMIHVTVLQPSTLQPRPTVLLYNLITKCLPTKRTSLHVPHVQSNKQTFSLTLIASIHGPACHHSPTYKT